VTEARKKAIADAVAQKVAALTKEAADDETQDQEGEADKGLSETKVAEIAGVAITKVLEEHPLFKAIQATEPAKKKVRKNALTTKDKSDIAEIAAEAALKAVTGLFGGEEAVQKLQTLSTLKFVKASELGGKKIVKVYDNEDAEGEHDEKAGEGEEKSFEKMDKEERQDALGKFLLNSAKSR